MTNNWSRSDGNSLRPKRVRTDGALASATPSNRRGQKANTAYEKYKADLHAMFEGKKPLPEHMQDMLGTAKAPVVPAGADAVFGRAKASKPSGKPERRTRRRVASGKETYASLLDSVRAANSAGDVTQAVDKLLAGGHQLPDDDEILSKALSHQDDAVLDRVVAQLEGLGPSFAFRSPRLLRTRLESAALMTGDDQLRTRCEALRAAIL